MGRRVNEILSARTGDGYVFRVDLRLRPTPEATPIVLPVNAAISYYESQALAWEQAAFIRARACAGDTGLGPTLGCIEPPKLHRELMRTRVTVADQLRCAGVEVLLRAAHGLLKRWRHGLIQHANTASRAVGSRRASAVSGTRTYSLRMFSMCSGKAS